MVFLFFNESSSIVLILFLVENDVFVVFVVIMDIEGLFYCLFGVMMVFGVDGMCVGILLFGCVEFDIVLYVFEVFVVLEFKVVCYGWGLFFVDI